MRIFDRKIGGQKGFTIIEAVVSAGVFAFAVVSSLGVYLAVVQLDSKSRAERTVQQNARFIMDYISKEIRNGSIDYSVTQSTSSLTLINQLDQQEIISYDSTTQDVSLTKTGLGTTTLNSSEVVVTNFQVILNPVTNPFDIANDIHIQPHVTVVMTLTSTNPKAIESANINLQSTFTVRDYPTRQ